MNLAGSLTIRDTYIASPPIVSICILAFAGVVVAESRLESSDISAFSTAASPKVPFMDAPNFGRPAEGPVFHSDTNHLRNAGIEKVDLSSDPGIDLRSGTFSKPGYRPLNLVADFDRGAIRRNDAKMASPKRQAHPKMTQDVISPARTQQVQAKYSASRTQILPPETEMAAVANVRPSSAVPAKMITAALPDHREGVLDGGLLAPASAPAAGMTVSGVTQGLPGAGSEPSAIPAAVEHTQISSFKQASGDRLEQRFDQTLTAQPATAKVAALVQEPDSDRAIPGAPPKARLGDIKPLPVTTKAADAPIPQANRPALVQSSQALAAATPRAPIGQSAHEFSSQPSSGGIEKPHQTSMGIEFNVPALVNGKAIGRLPLLISNGQMGRSDSVSANISVRLADLITLLKPRMDAGLYKELSSAENSKAYVTLNDFRARGISVSFSDDDRLEFQFK